MPIPCHNHRRVTNVGRRLEIGGTTSHPATVLEGMLAGLAWLPVWLVPSTVFNPVDTSDVADYLAKCAFDGRRGMRAEIGGPEDLSLVEFARQYQQARGMNQAIWPLPLPDTTARGMGFVVSNGVRGTVSWSAWLERQFAEARQAA